MHAQGTPIKLLQQHCIFKGAKMIGQDQYELFVTERLERGNVAITDTIKHNKVALFGTPTEKKGSNKEQKMVALKNDCFLFQDYT